MKWVIALVVFAVIVGAGIFAYDMAWADPAESVGIAYAKPDKNQAVEFQVMVTRAIIKEGPNVDPEGNPQWDQWNAGHIILADASGAPVTWVMSRRSEVVPEFQTGNLDHYVNATLKAGTKYTCTWKPVSSDKKTYVYTFTTPTDGPKFTRVDFLPHD